MSRALALSLIEGANAPDVAPLVNGEMIDKSNLGAGALARYIRTEIVGTTKKFPKHIFRAASGKVFALGGDALLNGMLRRVKEGDLLWLEWGGKVASEGDYEKHAWTMKLLNTLAPDKLRELAQLTAEVTALIDMAITSAQETRRQRNGSGGAPSGDEYQHTDADAEAFFRG